MSMHLVWPGPASSYLLNALSNFIIDYYPHVDDAFHISRNLEEDIRELIKQNKSMMNLDNEIYFIGDISELVIEFLIRNNNEEIFPNMLLNTYDLHNLPDSGAEALFDIIVGTIEHVLDRPLNININETWNQKTYQLSITERKGEIMEDFEKNQLGIFLYLLYLRDYFKNNKDVCVIISDLAPLIKQSRVLEKDIGLLSKQAFIAKNPAYTDDYDELDDIYKKRSTSEFRFLLLYVILLHSGPYIQISRNKDTEMVDAQVPKSFVTLLSRCENTDARYTISMLILSDYKAAHANIVIIDRKAKTIERYEPNGYIASPSFGRVQQDIFGDVADKADDVLYQLAKKKGYSYHPPAYFCPKYGIQEIEKYFQGTIGYCVTWSILYGIERVESGLTREDVARNFLDILVRKYRLKGLTEEEKAHDVEKVIIGRIQTVFEDMDVIYKELSQALDIKIRYEQGKLVYFS